MADAPWFKFYASDFLNGVRRLSGLERGVYITLISMMYDQGKPLSDDLSELAEDCGVTRRQFDAALAELVRRKKIVETADGLWNERVSCEILARTERISKAKSAVEAREQKKTQQNQSPKTSLDDRPMINRSSIQNQKVDVEEKKERICSETAAPPPNLFAVAKDEKPKKRAEYPAEFEAFWKDYPTQPSMSKAEAAKAWGKLSAEEIAKVLGSVPVFRAWLAKQKADYPVVHAVRYITQRRYEGYLQTGNSQASQPVDWNARLTFAREKREWSTAKWGPKPGEAGCQAPRDLLKPGDGVGWAEFKRAS
ncbi:MAG: DUF1376 domain-containing protein [Bacteroidota bacterium]